jgi:radical SAM superfamily enzyme YgiQ (UPF0313 family)
VNVLLVGPYKAEKLRVGQFLSPPNGLYRISSYIRKNHSVEPEVYDCDLEGIAGLFEKVSKKKYSVIGFSILYPTITNSIEIINAVKNLSPDSLLVGGGQGAIFSPDILFSLSKLDVIVKGFGEFPILEIIKKFDDNKLDFKKLECIPGLFVRNKNTLGYIQTPERKMYSSEEFEEIASSFNHSIVPYEKYWEFMEKIYTPDQLKVMKNDDLLYTIRIMTSSHCPMKCTFCSSTNFLDGIKKCQPALSMSVQKIIDSIKQAIQYHPKTSAIYLVDDNLLQNRERVKELCLKIIENFSGRKLSFFCLGRVDNVDGELLKLMAKADFKFIIYGVESFSEKILLDMHKNVRGDNPQKVAEKAVKETLAVGITPLMNLILFYPTSTINDILITIESAVKLVEQGARLTAYSFVEVYPGSKILEQKGLIFDYKEFEIGQKKIKLPWTILPNNEEVKSASLYALKIRPILVDYIKSKYSYSGDLPHPVFALTLFWAFYSAIGKSTKNIETVVDKLMSKAIEPEKQIIALKEKVIA